MWRKFWEIGRPYRFIMNVFVWLVVSLLFAQAAYNTLIAHPGEKRVCTWVKED